MRPTPAPHPDRADRENAVLAELPYEARLVLAALDDLPDWYPIGTVRLTNAEQGTVRAELLRTKDVRVAVQYGRLDALDVFDTLFSQGLLRPVPGETS